MRVRNVRRYASPKCSTNRDHQGRGNSKFQTPTTNETSDATLTLPVCKISLPFEIRICLRFGSGAWIFPEQWFVPQRWTVRTSCGVQRRRYVRFCSGALAQLVRAPPCHGGGCGFEPRRLRGFCITLSRLTTIVLGLRHPTEVVSQIAIAALLACQMCLDGDRLR